MHKNLETILSYTKEENGCLIWQRAINTDGYPRAVFDNNNNGKVHRVVWEITNDKSATGLVVRHTCDNPRCVNPAHLEIGSHTDNMLDRTRRERHGAAKLTHAQVLIIRDLYDTKKYTQKQLSVEFGVHVNTINSIVNRKHWKHL